MVIVALQLFVIWLQDRSVRACKQIKERKEKYQKACEQNIMSKDMENMNQQEKWDHIVKCCHDATEATVEKLRTGKKVKIQKLSSYPKSKRR